MSIQITIDSTTLRVNPNELDTIKEFIKNIKHLIDLCENTKIDGQSEIEKAFVEDFKRVVDINLNLINNCSAMLKSILINHMHKITHYMSVTNDIVPTSKGNGSNDYGNDTLMNRKDAKLLEKKIEKNSVFNNMSEFEKTRIIAGRHNGYVVKSRLARLALKLLNRTK